MLIRCTSVLYCLLGVVSHYNLSARSPLVLHCCDDAFSAIIVSDTSRALSHTSVAVQDSKEIICFPDVIHVGQRPSFEKKWKIINHETKKAYHSHRSRGHSTSPIPYALGRFLARLYTYRGLLSSVALVLSLRLLFPGSLVGNVSPFGR